MSVLPCNADGYAIPAADLLADQIIECGIDDEDFGDPETEWPTWTDEIRLGLGDDPPVDGHASAAALYEPTQEDWADFHAWCREQDERNQDLEDAYRESQYQDLLEGIARFSDADLMAAGLPVG